MGKSLKGKPSSRKQRTRREERPHKARQRLGLDPQHRHPRNFRQGSRKRSSYGRDGRRDHSSEDVDMPESGQFSGSEQSDSDHLGDSGPHYFKRDRRRHCGDPEDTITMSADSSSSSSTSSDSSSEPTSDSSSHEDCWPLPRNLSQDLTRMIRNATRQSPSDSSSDSSSDSGWSTEDASVDYPDYSEEDIRCAHDRNRTPDWAHESQNSAPRDYSEDDDHPHTQPDWSDPYDRDQPRYSWERDWSRSSGHRGYPEDDWSRDYSDDDHSQRRSLYEDEPSYHDWTPESNTDDDYYPIPSDYDDYTQPGSSDSGYGHHRDFDPDDWKHDVSRHYDPEASSCYDDERSEERGDLRHSRDPHLLCPSQDYHPPEKNRALKVQTAIRRNQFAWSSDESGSEETEEYMNTFDEPSQPPTVNHPCDPHEMSPRRGSRESPHKTERGLRGSGETPISPVRVKIGKPSPPRPTEAPLAEDVDKKGPITRAQVYREREEAGDPVALFRKRMLEKRARRNRHKEKSQGVHGMSSHHDPDRKRRLSVGAMTSSSLPEKRQKFL